MLLLAIEKESRYFMFIVTYFYTVILFRREKTRKKLLFPNLLSDLQVKFYHKKRPRTFFAG